MSGFNLSEWALRNRPLVLYFAMVLAIAGIHRTMDEPLAAGLDAGAVMVRLAGEHLEIEPLG